MVSRSLSRASNLPRQPTLIQIIISINLGIVSCSPSREVVRRLLACVPNSFMLKWRASWPWYIYSLYAPLPQSIIYWVSTDHAISPPKRLAHGFVIQAWNRLAIAWFQFMLPRNSSTPADLNYFHLPYRIHFYHFVRSFSFWCAIFFHLILQELYMHMVSVQWREIATGAYRVPIWCTTCVVYFLSILFNHLPSWFPSLFMISCPGTCVLQNLHHRR
jgi:hypothetical protein